MKTQICRIHDFSLDQMPEFPENGPTKSYFTQKAYFRFWQKKTEKFTAAFSYEIDFFFTKIYWFIVFHYRPLFTRSSKNIFEFSFYNYLIVTALFGHFFLWDRFLIQFITDNLRVKFWVICHKFSCRI